MFEYEIEQNKSIDFWLGNGGKLAKSLAIISPD